MWYYLPKLTTELKLTMHKYWLLAVLATFTLYGGGNSMNEPDLTPVDEVTFASFNVSFAHDNDPTENYDRWINYFSLDEDKQNDLIALWKSGKADAEQKSLAERVIQIRNIAAIIQHKRPDVLLLTEFNNDGVGKDMRALNGFQKNYLGVAQSLNSVNGGDMQKPIHYPFVANYGTNTGLMPSSPLLNFGNDKAVGPNDAHGFGYYHGHYGFALMSKFEIDTNNTRTFQTFKWKDLPEHHSPYIPEDCDVSKLPKGMKCGDHWYNDQQWQVLRLSSKNHVDAPILIPTKDGTKVIHALMSHPVPPAFDPIARQNRTRNAAENAFWLHYLNDCSALYDDKGFTGGLDMNEDFVLLGDLNADAALPDDTLRTYSVVELVGKHTRVNTDLAKPGSPWVPTSEGARQAPKPRNHPMPETRTSTFGLRVDYAVPSRSLEIVDSGVFWPAEGEPGRLLMNDKRVGKYGDGKEVSSDHRYVWSTVKTSKPAK